jgi:hypothetical protein
MMKNSIKAMEEKTAEVMKMVIQMAIEEDCVNTKTMSAIGLLSEMLEASFKVQYDLAEELEQIKDLIKYKN